MYKGSSMLLTMWSKFRVPRHALYMITLTASKLNITVVLTTTGCCAPEAACTGEWQASVIRQYSAHLEGAEHGQEALADDKGEQEVDGYSEALASRARLQRLDLARYQPPERTPAPAYTPYQT